MNDLLKKNINAFIEFEEKHFENLKNFKFVEADLMMWPYIRDVVAGAILEDENWLSKGYDASIGSNLKNVNYLRYAKELLRGIFKNVGHHNVMILSDDNFNVKLEDGQYHNWLYDPYAELFDNDVAFYERSTSLTISRPRANRHVICNDYMLVSVYLGAKIVRVSKKTEEQIVGLKAYIKQQISRQQWNALEGKLDDKLRSLAKRLVLQKKAYRRLFRRVHPKILFINAGCYSRGHILKIANEMGIVTIELQHGMFPALYLPYNYANNALKDDEFCKLFPKYIFLFGHYSMDRYNAPPQCIPVGIPGKRREKNEDNKKRILFSTNPINHSYVHNVIEAFMKTEISKGYECYLRPHPAEFGTRNSDKALAESYGMIFNAPSEPIEEILDKVNYVITGGSSVIFDAIRMGVQPILLKGAGEDVSDYPLEDVIIVEDCQQFVKYISENENRQEHKRFVVEKYYEPNWKENVLKFLGNLNCNKGV